MIKRWYATLASVFFVIYCWVFVGEVGGEANYTLTTILYLFPEFLAVGSGVWVITVYGWRNINSKVIGLFTLGLGAWLAGEVLWVVFDLFLEIEPFPSLADVFYLLAPPLLFLSLVWKLRLTKIDWQSREVRKLLMLTGVVGILLAAIVFYFGVWRAYDPELSRLENAILAGYGITDWFVMLAAVLVMLIAREYQGGKLFKVWMVILGGITCTFSADVLYAMNITQYEGGLKPYVYLDLLWVLSYLLIGYGLYDMGRIIRQVQRKVIGDE